jgi:signal peptidase I
MVKKYFPVRVMGHSMRPTILEGDFLLVKKTDSYQIGELVVVQLAEQKLVKRVVDEKADQVWLSGDNVKASDDSRKFGWIEKNQIIGKVLFRYWPKFTLNFKVS